MSEELKPTDEQCDRLVSLTMEKLAAKGCDQYGDMTWTDLNPNIMEHHALRRSIVRVAYGAGEAEAIATWNRRAQPEPSAESVNASLLTCLEDALTSFADCVEGGEADEWVQFSRAAVANAKAHAAQPEPAAPAEQDWSEPELWAEIYRLRAAVKGPDGFDSWQDAATDERIRRVKAERALAAPSVAPEPPTREALAEIVRSHLTSTYHCTRVWEAWNVGTMTEDDFEPASESDMAEDIADAILANHPPRAPLTDADLDKIIAAQWGTHPGVIYKAHRAFARAVLAADRGISAEGEKT